MAYEETELKQADQLDRVVENIIQGDCDLFEGVQARRFSHDTMAVVDLATFVMPLEIAEGKEFEQRTCLLAAWEVQRLTPDYDLGPRKAIRVWSRFMSPILGVGLTAPHSAPRCSWSPCPQVAEVVQLTLSADRGITSRWVSS
jgi:hypothetical protein